MSWLRIEGRMPNHRKVSCLSDAAFRLYVTASCWCVEEETDGLIPPHVPATLPRAPRGKALVRAVDELVAAGVWDALDDGQHIVHDHLVYNPSAAESKAVREAKSAAGAAGGRAKANGLHGKNLAGASHTAKQTPSKPVAGASGLPEETPSKTIADAKQNSSSRAGAGARSDSDSDSDSEPQAATAAPERQRPGGRIRCPVPVPVSGDTLNMLHGNIGLPPEVSRPWLLRWAIKQAAAESDLRPIETWQRCAVQALSGEWSKDKAAMRVLVADNPEVDVAADLAERRRKSQEASRIAGEEKRRENAELAAKISAEEAS